MKSLFRKALIITVLFSVVVAMLTVNYNQAYASPGYEYIGFDILRNSDRTFQQIVCPDSNEHGVGGYLSADRGIVSGTGPVSNSGLLLQGREVRDQDYVLDGEIRGHFTNWQIIGESPNQEFIGKGVE